jgi:hypothetical protein
MMFEKIAKLLRNEKASSVEIHAEIEAIETESPKARERLADLGGCREALLVEGNDPGLDALEKEIAAACRDVARLDAMLAALRGRLQRAEEDERRAVLLVKIEAARKASDRGTALVAKYLKYAAEMVNTLAELQVCESVVRESWEPARELDIDRVEMPLRRAATGADYTEIIGLVALPAVDGHRQFLWPPSDSERKAEIEALQQKLRAVG